MNMRRVLAFLKDDLLADRFFSIGAAPGRCASGEKPLRPRQRPIALPENL